MKSDSFAVFILTNGRPHNQKTLRTLQRQGYTGKVYLIVDDLDTTLPEYRAAYGDQVIVFDKRAEASRCDPCTNREELRSILYARNATFEIARRLGVRYFLQLDDDDTDFRHRFDHRGKYNRRAGFPTSLDRTFAIMLEYYIASPFASICFAQSGDIFGGEPSTNCATIRTKRKAMNSFFCDTERPFQFTGIFNDDVNTYTAAQRRGLLFLTFFQFVLQQTPTQANPGLLSELYVQTGTYVKSFYSVMVCPSAVHINQMGLVDPRIHHKVNYNACAPAIIRAVHCKRLQHAGA